MTSGHEDGAERARPGGARPLPLLPEDATPPSGEGDAVARVLAYHERTKHHLRRYARGPGYLDWATQPDPFRTYTGTERVELPLAADRLDTAYGDLYRPGVVRPLPLNVETVGTFFELALGLSAWKEFRGSRWALRCNPSSGNLHPTEGYAVLPPAGGLRAGVYHYVSRDHCLERRCAAEGAAAVQLAKTLPGGAFLAGLSSIHWREGWKYGERGYRYCQHDAGHAVATIRYAAAALGWRAVLLDELSDDAVAALLGLDRHEAYAAVAPEDREHPDALLLVGPLRDLGVDVAAVRAALAQGRWAGRANPLSRAHVRWEAIDEAAAAAHKPATAPPGPVDLPALPPLLPSPAVSAARLIRQRRSAVDLDGLTAIPAATFYHIFDHLLPRPDTAPWDALPWRPHVHAAVFVHRVTGLRPGLYLLERDLAVHPGLQAALSRRFAWERPAGCPEHLPFYLLAEADCRDAARTVSCHQDIAADGAFSLGMIVDFEDSIRARGAWWYRRLFWEAGVLGQVLYLEAEAAGVRGTGIGCYFDDPMHDLLGLKGKAFQDLYHFTAGGPVEDPRLRTIAPYAHLTRR